MTERTFTAAEMEDHAGALPKLRGHMPDCGCSHCGQMNRVAAMLRQGADAVAALTAAAERERVGMAAARTAICQELSQAIDRFNNDDSKGMGDLIDVIAPWLEEAQAPMADVVWMTRDEMRESAEREQGLREENARLMAASDDYLRQAVADAIAVQQVEAALNDCKRLVTWRPPALKRSKRSLRIRAEAAESALAAAQAEVARLTAERDEHSEMREEKEGQVFSLLAEIEAVESALAAERQKVTALVYGIQRVYNLAGRAQADMEYQTLTRLAFGKMAIELNDLLTLALGLPSPDAPQPPGTTRETP